MNTWRGLQTDVSKLPGRFVSIFLGCLSIYLGGSAVLWGLPGLYRAIAVLILFLLVVCAVVGVTSVLRAFLEIPARLTEAAPVPGVSEGSRVVGFGTTWAALPSGWRWALWILGGLFSGLPFLLDGIPNSASGVMSRLGWCAALFLLYLPWMLSGRRKQLLAGYACLGLLGGLLFPVVGHRRC